MGFLTAFHTDVGTRNTINQDSLLLMQGRSGQGDVLMAAVCDGMGGLAKGELASSTMVHAFAEWFRERLPGFLLRGFTPEDLWREWGSLVQGTNHTIRDYAGEKDTSLGTTAVAVLVIGRAFFHLNVGDSRLYLLSDDGIQQLTHDQTLVQQEMDAGRMTFEQSLTDPNRNTLLQCVGGADIVSPVYGAGVLQAGCEFMLCSDGFYRAVSPQEFQESFAPEKMDSRETMEEKLRELTAVSIARKEEDNISAILIKYLE